MTVALPKTKAEEVLAAQFKRDAALLPGDESQLSERKRAFAAFEKLGLPHRRVEAWKYTDLRSGLTQLAPISTRDATPVAPAHVDAALKGLATLDALRVVFVNGQYRPELSTTAEPGLITVLAPTLRDGTAMTAPLAASSEAMVALNTALVTDGATIHVAANATIAKPVLIVALAAGPQPQLSSLRHRVELAAGATATIIEAHVTVSGASAGQANSVIEIAIGDGASLSHAMLSLEGSKATGHTAAGAVHIETISAALGAHATLKSFQLTAGTGLARTQSFVTFKGEHARIDISGLMLGRDRDHIDTTLVIDHAVPNCVSRELFKAVLDDTARAVFQGKVIVRPDAQKTDGKQMAKALMLSEACEFDSKPELEIYADDVVCGHGATVAELDPGQLFYLRARGIPEPEARAMLIESFAGEALEKIEDETLRNMLFTIARDWLAAKRS